MKKFFTALIAVGTVVLPLTAAHAESNAVDCTLENYGSCCPVTIGKERDAKISTSIDSAGMVDFVLIKGAPSAECSFLFDGEAKLPMHVYPNEAGFDFAGTWIGGNFALRYRGDTANSGTCSLTVYAMNIESPKMLKFPDKCENNRFDTPLAHKN
jgi:hypothetical protein